MTLAPIVLFVYNRPVHTLQTLEALANNTLANESVLYIYADGIRDGTDNKTTEAIQETRKILKQKQWCRNVYIIESEKNKGLATSILEGVTNILNKYGKIIVLEDDIITSTGFLKYMNDALDMYEREEKVMHVSSFVPVTRGAQKLPDIYFLHFMSCWGWGTWKRAWNLLITDIEYLYTELPKQPNFKDFNLNESVNMFSQILRNRNKTLDTWAIKWYSTIFLNEGLCLYPKISLSKNIGILDQSGENCICDDNRYEVILAQSQMVSMIKIEENIYAKKYLQRFYTYGNNASFRQIIKNNLFIVYKKILKK